MNLPAIILNLLIGVRVLSAMEGHPLDDQFRKCRKSDKLLKSFWKTMDGPTRIARMDSFIAIAISLNDAEALFWLLKRPESKAVDIEVLKHSELVAKSQASMRIKNVLSKFLTEEKGFFLCCQDRDASLKNFRRYLHREFFRSACVPAAFKLALDSECDDVMVALLSMCRNGSIDPFRHMLDNDTVLKAFVYACDNCVEDMIEPLLELTRFDPSLHGDLNFVEKIILHEGETAQYTGASILLTFLSDNRIDPALNNDEALKQAYHFGNISILAILLAHPKVNPRVLEGLVSSSPTTDGEVKAQNYIKSMGALLDDARTGDLDAFDTIPTLDSTSMLTLFNAASFHGHIPIIERLSAGKDLKKFISCYPYNQYCAALFCFDQPETALIFIDQINLYRAKPLDILLGKALAFRAYKSVHVIHGWIDGLEEVVEQIKGIEDLDAPDFNTKIDLLVQQAQATGKFKRAVNIRNYLMNRVAIQLWKYHVRHSNILPTEISDNISSYLETSY